MYKTEELNKNEHQIPAPKHLVVLVVGTFMCDRKQRCCTELTLYFYIFQDISTLLLDYCVECSDANYQSFIAHISIIMKPYIYINIPIFTVYKSM